MNWKHVMTVFKKEVKDIARDKKTLITSLLVPLLMYPVLFGLIGGGVEKMEKSINENITIALAPESDTEDVKTLVQNEILSSDTHIKLVEITKEPVEAIRSEEARFVLDFEKGYAEKLQEGKPFSIKIIYDDSKAESSGSIGILMDAINGFNQRVVTERLQAQGIDPEILEPVRIEESVIPQDQKSGNTMLMMILPMMIAILIVVGGIPAATDLVAGEKERSTFEPLLTTKPGRTSILFGKYLTVTLFSLISVISQFAGMAVGLKVNPNYLNMGGSGGSMNFNIPPVALILILLITIALGMVFSGIQLAVSTYAKSFKEAQTYLSFLIFAAMIPAYATMMMQPSDIQSYMFAVPLLNAIAALKMVLGGVVNYSHLLIALGTTAVYVAISLVLAARLFNKEKVLFRS